jgi:hypothetical protein
MEKCPSCLREHAATTPKGKQHNDDAAGLQMQTSNDALQQIIFFCFCIVVPFIDPSSSYWTVTLIVYVITPGCYPQRSDA